MENERYGDKILSHARPGEAERLELSGRTWDPNTIEIVTSLQPRPDWRCLEVGPGIGSISNWLAARCPDGRVVAADIQTDLVAAHAGPGVEVVRHDLVADDFPAGSFDFISARTVLMHIRERQAVLSKMVGWLAPGGTILIEDLGVFVGESSVDQDFRKMMTSVQELGPRTIGADMRHWPRSFPRPLVEAGLDDVGVHAYCPVVAKDTTARDYLQTSMQGVRPRIIAEGIATEEEADRWEALLDDPGFMDLGLVMMSMWGRR
jgi:ubiquinone/menaquinone biosynthesis C-methylase UbiE